MLRRALVVGGGAALTLVAFSLALAQQENRPQGRGGFGGFFGGPGGGFGAGSAWLVGMPEVQKELAVSDEQKGPIEDLLADLREKGQQLRGNFQELQSLSEEERQKRFEEMGKKSAELVKQADDLIGMVLEPKQLERLSQLRLQREGVAALGRPDVADKLGLGQEQRDTIREIQQGLRPDPAAFRNFGQLTEEERAQARAKMQEKFEKANSDMLAVLSDTQKANWEKMQGKKFDFPPPPGFGGNRPPQKGASKKAQ